jgi:hypothetical protein
MRQNENKSSGWSFKGKICTSDFRYIFNQCIMARAASLWLVFF